MSEDSGVAKFLAALIVVFVVLVNVAWLGLLGWGIFQLINWITTK